MKVFRLTDVALALANTDLAYGFLSDRDCHQITDQLLRYILGRMLVSGGDEPIAIDLNNGQALQLSVHLIGELPQ